MHGATILDLSDLRILDKVRAECDQGAFTGVIKSVTKEEGITLDNGATTYVIAFADIPEYDFYPRGDTIGAIQRRGIEPEPEEIEVNENTTKFFEIFTRYQNLALGKEHSETAAAMVRVMIRLSTGNHELEEAYNFVINERMDKVTAVVVDKAYQ